MSSALQTRVCPCCSGNTYEECCQPFHEDKQIPQTAEQLMRSRYCAYALRLVDYLARTTHPDRSKAFDRDAFEASACETKWLGLEILKKVQGMVTDKMGRVEFKATYAVGESKYTHHELSRFRKHSGRWYYLDGVVF